MWPKERAQHLRGQRGAAHPEQHDIASNPSAAHLGGERLDVRDVAEHPLRDRQPAEPVGDLGDLRRAPQAAVAVAQALGHVLGGGRAHAVLRRGRSAPPGSGPTVARIVAHGTIVVASPPVSSPGHPYSSRPRNRSHRARPRNAARSAEGDVSSNTTGQPPDRNLALELVRVTEAAALAAAPLVGLGDKEAADQAAVDGMRYMLHSVQMDGDGRDRRGREGRGADALQRRADRRRLARRRSTSPSTRSRGRRWRPTACRARSP